MYTGLTVCPDAGSQCLECQRRAMHSSHFAPFWKRRASLPSRWIEAREGGFIRNQTGVLGVEAVVWHYHPSHSHPSECHRASASILHTPAGHGGEADAGGCIPQRARRPSGRNASDADRGQTLGRRYLSEVTSPGS